MKNGEVEDKENEQPVQINVSVKKYEGRNTGLSDSGVHRNLAFISKKTAE